MGVNRFEMQSCYCEPVPGFPNGYAGMCPAGTEVGSYDEGVAEFCDQCEQNPCAECVANPPYAKSFTEPGPSWPGGIGSSLCVTHGIMHPYECYAIEPPPEGCSPPPPPPPPSPPPPPVKPPKTTCKNGGGTDGTPAPGGGFPGGGGQQD